MKQYTITVATETYADYIIEAESVAGAIHWAEVVATDTAYGDPTLPEGVRRIDSELVHITSIRAF